MCVPGSAAAAAGSAGGGSSPEAPQKLHVVHCFTAPHTHLQPPKTGRCVNKWSRVHKTAPL